MKLHSPPSIAWKFAQWAALRIVIIILPIVIDLCLQSYFHFTQLEALVSTAVMGLVTLFLMKARAPSERSQPL
jgi:hypothetical protein